MKNRRVKLLAKKQRELLKYRSYQIMLYLFHLEDLKRFIIGSLRTTNDIHGKSNKGLKLDDHLNQIVRDGIITEKEKDELVELIDYRNDMSHEIHKMVSDLGDTSIYQLAREDGKSREHYRPEALVRLTILSNKIRRGFESRYVMLSSFDKFVFEPAERALHYECSLIFRRMIKEEMKKEEIK